MGNTDTIVSPPTRMYLEESAIFFNGTVLTI